MHVECPLELGGVDAVRQLPAVVVDRVDVDRSGAAEDEPRERGLVAVAGHHDRLAGRDRGEQRDVHVLADAPGGEQGLVGADGLREQLHGRRLDLPRLVAGVDALVHADVGAEHLNAGPPHGVGDDGAAAREVSGYPEDEVAAGVEGLDRLADRHRVGLGAGRPALRLLLGLLRVALTQLVGVHDRTSTHPGTSQPCGRPIRRPEPECGVSGSSRAVLPAAAAVSARLRLRPRRGGGPRSTQVRSTGSGSPRRTVAAGRASGRAR